MPEHTPPLFRPLPRADRSTPRTRTDGRKTMIHLCLGSSSIHSKGKTVAFLGPSQMVGECVVCPWSVRLTRNPCLLACQDAAALTATRTILCPMMRPPFKRPSGLSLSFLPPFTLLGSAPNDKPKHPPFLPCFPPLSLSLFPAARGGRSVLDGLNRELDGSFVACPRNLGAVRLRCSQK